ncbi:unnamed protein product [Euphydryas editha]|uniref:Reverse transcriptase n=1 Tax=Euphydryas editha TaxID=104508 RepID=A0AAU9U9X2_EUPED|nr:unnamed protein product [Euphydryas editha]
MEYSLHFLTFFVGRLRHVFFIVQNFSINASCLVFNACLLLLYFVPCKKYLILEERKTKKSEILSDVVSAWQTRWTASGDGRELYGFFPDIASRLERRWVEPDYVLSQIFTGHGCFRGRLHRMTLCDTPSCYCGHDSETRDHILWECNMYKDERKAMLDEGKPSLL